MNLLSAFSAYPMPAGYTAGQPVRTPQKPAAGDEQVTPVKPAGRMDYLPARPDEYDMADQAASAMADDLPDEIRSFLTTANNNGERRIGRFLDIQA